MDARLAAAAFSDREILPIIPEVHATLGHNNPKSLLQQHILRQTAMLPRYEPISEGGHSNDRRFTVGIFAGNRLLDTGTATSIKEAGPEAARAALRGDLAPDT